MFTKIPSAVGEQKLVIVLYISWLSEIAKMAWLQRSQEKEFLLAKEIDLT